MPRNSAANQKRYRERKKMTDPNYMQAERERVRRYYVPTSQLSARAAKERARKGRESMRRQRERARDTTQMSDTSHAAGPDSVSSSDCCAVHVAKCMGI